MSFFPSMLLGVRCSVGFFISTFLFGILFGVAAATANIGLYLTVGMSALVFSASVQFAAIEFWTSPLPLSSILLSVSLLSARHVLLGLSLTHHLHQHSLGMRLLLLGLLNDPGAVTAMALDGRKDKLGYMTGYGLSLLCSWLVSTWLGYVFAHRFSGTDMSTLDYAGPLVMASLMVLFVKGSKAPRLPWVVSGVVAYVMHVLGSDVFWILPVAVCFGVIIGLIKGEIDARVE